MEIEVLIMTNDYQIQKKMVEITNDSTVEQCLDQLIQMGCIKSDHAYTVSCYGQRVKSEAIVSQDDRLELSLALPSDPMVRRRNRALKNKKK